jgi:hypothetical protein
VLSDSLDSRFSTKNNWLALTLLCGALSIATGCFVPAVSAQSSLILLSPEKATCDNNQISIKPLEGGVKINDTLPAIAPEYQIGKTLCTDQLESLTPNNQWYAIPSWFAGKWHQGEETTLSSHDYQSGDTAYGLGTTKAQVDVIRGQQKDKTGQIWDFIGTPTVTKAAIDGGIRYSNIVAFEPGQADDWQVVLKCRYDQIAADRQLKIFAASQLEEVSIKIPILSEKRDMILDHSSIKSFDAEGHPQSLQEDVVVWTKTAPYRDIDQVGTLNYKLLFVEFLKKIGREDLIPDNDKLAGG